MSSAAIDDTKSITSEFNMSSFLGGAVKWIVIGIMIGGVIDFTLFHGPVGSEFVSKLTPWLSEFYSAIGLDALLEWLTDLVPEYHSEPPTLPPEPTTPAGSTGGSVPVDEYDSLMD